jgi:hypothetical protein
VDFIAAGRRHPSELGVDACRGLGY